MIPWINCSQWGCHPAPTPLGQLEAHWMGNCEGLIWRDGVPCVSLGWVGESCVTSFAWITLRFSCPVVSVLWLPALTHTQNEPSHQNNPSHPSHRSTWNPRNPRNTWNHHWRGEHVPVWLVGGATKFRELHPFLHNCRRDSQSPFFLAFGGSLRLFLLLGMENSKWERWKSWVEWKMKL